MVIYTHPRLQRDTPRKNALNWSTLRQLRCAMWAKVSTAATWHAQCWRLWQQCPEKSQFLAHQFIDREVLDLFMFFCWMIISCSYRPLISHPYTKKKQLNLFGQGNPLTVLQVHMLLLWIRNFSINFVYTNNPGRRSLRGVPFEQLILPCGNDLWDGFTIEGFPLDQTVQLYPYHGKDERPGPLAGRAFVTRSQGYVVEFLVQVSSPVSTAPALGGCWLQKKGSVQMPPYLPSWWRGNLIQTRWDFDCLLSRCFWVWIFKKGRRNQREVPCNGRRHTS